MVILRVAEIRRMSREAREKKLAELRADLARLKMAVKAGGAIDKPSRVREIRRAIARILTINNEESREVKG